ncbi:MAG: phosphatidate cytidylyltransferase [Opitutaceae bacterium]
MAKRIISTIALWSIIAATIHFFGRSGIAVLCALVAAATQWELYAMLERLGHRPFRHLGVSLGVILMLLPYFVREYVGPDAKEGMESGIIAVTIVACCLRVMRERAGANRMETLIATVFGIVYAPFMLFFIVRILWLGETEVSGMMLAVWMLFAAKFCDVGALVVGSLIGKHKIAPSMSPGKTWEGAVGGVIIAAGMCAGLVAYFPQHYPDAFTPLVAALAAIGPSIVSIVSDLIESVLKRMAGVKDSGKTIPGIGGAFDLVDSLILSAPVAYLILRVLI